jgi:hypothetical protein
LHVFAIHLKAASSKNNFSGFARRPRLKIKITNRIQ